VKASGIQQSPSTLLAAQLIPILPSTSQQTLIMEQRRSPSASSHPSSFPTDHSEFDSDDRISFSKLDNKFLLVQEDGTEYEFDDKMKRWIPTLDEALLEEQQRAYRVSGIDESEPVEALRKKRKKEFVNGEDVRLSPFPNIPTLHHNFPSRHEAPRLEMRLLIRSNRKEDVSPKPPTKLKPTSHPAPIQPST